MANNDSKENVTNTENADDRPRRPLWQRLLLLRKRPRKRLRYVPTKIGFVVHLFVIFAIGTVAFAEYSMQPDFCRSCHIMEPYYVAWHDSTHKDVPCADCHFEPGFRNVMEGKFEASTQAVKFLTGTYGSKPHAQVRDASCLREGCHEKRLLEGKVNWPVPTQRDSEIVIRFDHTPHLDREKLRRGKSLRCTSCHSQIVQGQHLVVTLDGCFLCHFKGLEHGRDDQTLAGCQSCHEAPGDQIRLATGDFNHDDFVSRGVKCQDCHADAVVGDGAVPRQVCWNCHNQPEHLRRYAESTFLHENHVSEHKIECSSCHVQIVHHLTAAVPASSGVASEATSHMLDNTGSCGQCHTQLHNAMLDIYRGTGGRGVPDMPSAMFRTQVDCIACHRNPNVNPTDAQFAGQTFRANQATCDHCHGDEYKDRLEEWRQMVKQNFDVAEAMLLNAKNRLQKAEISAADRLKYQRLIDDAEHNLRMVKLGRGEHNVTYATALLSTTAEYARQVTNGLTAGAATARKQDD